MLGTVNPEIGFQFGLNVLGGNSAQPYVVNCELLHIVPDEEFGIFNLYVTLIEDRSANVKAVVVSKVFDKESILDEYLSFKLREDVLAKFIEVGKVKKTGWQIPTSLKSIS